MLKGTVGVSEHLGSDTFFHVHVENEIITARVNGEVDVHHGDTVFLDADPEWIYKFGSDEMAIL